VRRELVPRIAVRVPAYRATLSRAARNFGEAAHLLDELARADAAETTHGNEIEVARLRTLSVARAKNLLRFLIDARGWPMPDADRLEEAVRQALTSRRDARVRIELGMGELRRNGGTLCLVQAGLDLHVRDAVAWRGERQLALDAWGGVLAMTPRRGAGISASRLESAPVTIRVRRGGERLQLSADRPRRTVKNLLQEARIPAWERERVPFIYCGETLVCVPGVGIERRFQATRGERSILPSWSRLQVPPG
jgi:tRNA(Ile)-lysidine synthase